MKTYRNAKRLIFAVISTLLLVSNMTKAAAYFDPLALSRDKPLSDGPVINGPTAPCVWPDPDDKELTCGDFI